MCVIKVVMEPGSLVFRLSAEWLMEISHSADESLGTRLDADKPWDTTTDCDLYPHSCTTLFIVQCMYACVI